MGFGRRRMNKAQVMRMLRARAASRRSVQWVNEVNSEKRKETGKTVGNPIDVSPWDVNGRKSVKFPPS